MKRKYPFAIIEQLVKELAGEDMNEKINVLGVNIDSFTAKEAMKETIAFLESEPVSVIDVVSVDALMQMNDFPELKEKMNEFDMIVLDEIFASYNYDLVDKASVRNIVENYGGELVMTGRNPDEWFCEKADYISEIKKIKHPYDKGIVAREGIEY